MKITIEDNYPRIDKFLVKYLDSMPMSLIQRLIRKKKILLNGQKCKSSQEIKVKDIIDVFYSFKTQKEEDLILKPVLMSEKEKKNYIKLIIYENSEFIVINKPSNLAVQGGTKVKVSLKDIYEHVLEIKLYIVHRIDKDTSGLIILTKDRFSAAGISKLFLEKKIYKHYLTITDKKFLKNNDFLINTNNEDQIMKLRYRFLENKKNNFLYLVSLLTGRKHQIRLQFSLNNNPITNDTKFNRKIANGNLGLCAYSIKFNYKKNFYCFKLRYEEILNLFDF